MERSKLYIVSGLGADFKVLQHLRFPDHLEIVFLDWLIPEEDESFESYVQRMAARVDVSEPFYLLGYSFGGILVQEINRLKPAKRVVILGSIKSSDEKSGLIRFGKLSRIPQNLPRRFYNGGTIKLYSYFRKLFDRKNPRILQYFTVRDAYYLKWCVAKIVEWQAPENPDVVQILGDKDIVFPLKNSKPDYVIRGGTHLFPATRHKEVSQILAKIFADKSSFSEENEQKHK